MVPDAWLPVVALPVAEVPLVPVVPVALVPAFGVAVLFAVPSADPAWLPTEEGVLLDEELALPCGVVVVSELVVPCVLCVLLVEVVDDCGSADVLAW